MEEEGGEEENPSSLRNVNQDMQRALGALGTQEVSLRPGPGSWGLSCRGSLTRCCLGDATAIHAVSTGRSHTDRLYVYLAAMALGSKVCAAQNTVQPYGTRAQCQARHTASTGPLWARQCSHVPAPPAAPASVPPLSLPPPTILDAVSPPPPANTTCPLPSLVLPPPPTRLLMRSRRVVGASVHR